MGRNLLLVGLGGFLGSVCRYLIGLLLLRFWDSPFPFWTFAVNVLGCFIIGLVFGLSGQVNWLTPQWRLFLTTGFCGGFTTFSTFALENADLLKSGNLQTFALYAISSFVLGLLAVFAGIAITKP